MDDDAEIVFNCRGQDFHCENQARWNIWYAGQAPFYNYLCDDCVAKELGRADYPVVQVKLMAPQHLPMGDHALCSVYVKEYENGMVASQKANRTKWMLDQVIYLLKELAKDE